MPLTAEKPTQLLVDLVGALGGVWHGYVAMCRCPAHNDRDPSLSLRQGERNILVNCFAGCSREDVLRELGRVRTNTRHPIPNASPALGQGNAQRLWDQASDARGTLAERYLAGRNLLPVPHDVRFHPRCPYLPKPRTLFLPALLIAVREGRVLRAIQRIFLDPRTDDYVRKVMLGRPLQGAWAGERAGATLAIAEGFEDARAFSLIHQIPCWASLGAGRLNQLVIPNQVSALLIAEDNDTEGRLAAGLAVETYRRPGLTIERVPPPAGVGDWAKARAQGWRAGA